jgi:hypothetical protein
VRSSSHVAIMTLSRFQASLLAKAAFAEPAARKRFNDLGHEVAARDQQTPVALAAYHRAEIKKWWPIIKAANIKAR